MSAIEVSHASCDLYRIFRSLISLVIDGRNVTFFCFHAKHLDSSDPTFTVGLFTLHLIGIIMVLAQ